MLFADRLTLDAPRRLRDGYMAVRAKAARSGTYSYQGYEIDPENVHGLRDAGAVHVLRETAAVFDPKSAHSFIGKPITDDHPNEAVTADNWKHHARGTVMGAKWEEGGYLAFDLLLTDADAIGKVEAGKRELSNGYSAELEFGDFTASDGTKCVARQTNIVGNHVAIVDKGRAGSSCAITDGATCEGIPRQLFDELAQRTYDPAPDGGNVPLDRRETNKSHEGPSLKDGDAPMATKTILVDGLQVEVTDAAEAAINKLQGQLKDAASAKAKAETELATAKTELAAKDTEITTLKQAVEDAKVTPAQLRDAAKAYALVCDKARALKVEFAEDADASAIMKAVVDAKMGDAAKDWSADQVAASFAVLTKDAKVEQRDALTDAIKNGVRTQTDDSERQQAYGEMVSDLTDAWKPKAA